MVDQAWKLTMIATLEMERKLETKTSGTEASPVTIPGIFAKSNLA